MQPVSCTGATGGSHASVRIDDFAIPRTMIGERIVERWNNARVRSFDQPIRETDVTILISMSVISRSGVHRHKTA